MNDPRRTRPYGPPVDGLKRLAEFVKSDQPRNMVEVGAYAGESTIIFSAVLEDTKIHSIDPWENGYDDSDPASFLEPMSVIEKDFDARTAPFPNIQKIKMKSVAASRMFEDGALDLVYIDACHQYNSVKQDIELWLPKIQRGGWISGHDYCEAFSQVMSACDDCLGKPDEIFEDTSWAKRI